MEKTETLINDLLTAINGELNACMAINGEENSNQRSLTGDADASSAVFHGTLMEIKEVPGVEN